MDAATVDIEKKQGRIQIITRTDTKSGVLHIFQTKLYIDVLYMNV